MAEMKDLSKRAKNLTQALVLSGMLNIGLIATFAYFALKVETPVQEPLPFSETQVLTNAEILKNYSQLSFQELLSQLDNSELIEEGLTRRDLAVACLVAFHHFNLDGALGGQPLQKRVLPFTNSEGFETIALPVFPGLTDAQFYAIHHFAKTEKWPLSSQGLFYEMKRSGHDPTLVQAFLFTPEYHAVSTLFSKTGLPLTAEQLISLLLEGEWQTLSLFTEKQRTSFELTCERRRALLLDYLSSRSKTAAQLLIDSDAEFLLKRLSDAQILTLLDLYPVPNAALSKFAKDLIASPRTDAVWKCAATLLCTLSNTPLPQPYDHTSVLQRFLPQSSAPEPEILAVAKPALVAAKRMHTVSSGENLWKIARKYKVSVDAIMRVNNLETEKLRPGRELEIPER